jgi:hypothetical protein
MQIIGLGMLILNYQYLIYEQYQTIFQQTLSSWEYNEI